MAENLTPEQWLPILAKAMDDQSGRLATLRSYLTGNSPLPEMSANTRESWIRFQKKSRTGLAALTVDALAERTVPNGFITADGGTAAETTPSEAAGRRIWHDSRLSVVFADAIWEALGMSRSYLMLARDDDGQPVITVEKAEYVYAAPDALRPWRSQAAIKVWRDTDGNDYAYVWTPGARQRFIRPSKKNNRLQLKISGNWSLDGEAVSSPNRVPVYILENRDSQSEFENHTDTLDRIHEGILQRLVITAYQAFRQRAVKGELAEEDSDGNPNDWASLLAAAPGAMWQLPDGIDVWESAATDITPMLSSVKDDIRMYCAETRTPVPTALPDGANQTAEGALAAREGLIFKANDRVARMSSAFSDVLADAIRILVPEFEESVEIRWAPPQLASLTERYAAAAQAKAADVPWRSRMSDILGFSPEKIDAMELELASEQLQASMMFGEPSADAAV